MTRDCETCGGQGVLGVGRIGPEEFRSLATCGDCDGKGQEPVKCDLCGDAEAVREAWVVDNKAPTKASLLKLCNPCHDHDDTEIVEFPTRCLPARQADADVAGDHLAAALELLRPRHSGGRHAS